MLPTWFHWTGDELVMPTFVSAPHVRHPAARLRALRANPRVAVTIDTEPFPQTVLNLRGGVTVVERPGVVEEYALSARRYLGDDAARDFLAMLDHPVTTMARIELRPTWVGLIASRPAFRAPSAGSSRRPDADWSQARSMPRAESGRLCVCDDGRVRGYVRRPVPLVLALLLGACSDAPTTERGPAATTAAATSATTGAVPATGTNPTSIPSAPQTSPPTSPLTTAVSGSTSPPAAELTFTVEAFPVPAGTGPHDVSPASDGNVWFTAQRSGQLGLLDPATGDSRLIDLGDGSRPHGVITAADGAAWVTDGGRNSIIRVDPSTEALTEHPLPADAAGANLNTATLGADGVVWFTGQSGWYGKVDLDGTVTVFPAPNGRGPYGITTTPSGEVYFASLAGSYVARIDQRTGAATVIEPPVPGQGSRRVWADSTGRVWVSGWNSGDVYVYDPADSNWQTWHLPGDQPQPYAVFVDDRDAVWLSDFRANALVRFDPATEMFTTFALPSTNAQVRQLHGRPGEVWGAESAADQLVVVRRSP